MASRWGDSWGASWGATWDRVLSEVARRHAGGYKLRKGYIIKGKRYWLSDDELARVIAQELQDISRKDVKEITAGKPKPLDSRTWAIVKPLERIEALAAQMNPVVPDESEDDILMMFV